MTVRRQARRKRQRGIAAGTHAARHRSKPSTTLLRSYGAWDTPGASAAYCGSTSGMTDPH
ncbi:hypothetical protein GCM10010339_66560 [Streptomyces alanosinicus]|uniref:Uncharacterized protein n=1 Tax=Streptomyces alanosinicus TaxID=68171 RepID=A0A919D4S9_9ACTN|nr:hypothetical protein GCM10010339_66560 [Streptomyces alanosinicus]